MKFVVSVLFVVAAVVLQPVPIAHAAASGSAGKEAPVTAGKQTDAPSPANWRQRISIAGDVTGKDIEAEVTFGREVAARIVARYGLAEDQQLMKYVNLVGRVIAMNSSRPELEFRFAVLDTAEINAYAAPGGYIFVTKGAIMHMQDEAELAAVLAHEIGHVTERHMVKELSIRASDDSSAVGFARFVGGSTEAARTAFSQLVDKALDILFKDGNKREDEMQADKDALLYCTLADYDPSALARYFKRLSAEKGKQTEVLDKTHPPYDARIAWLSSMLTEENIDVTNYKTNKQRFSQVVKR